MFLLIIKILCLTALAEAVNPKSLQSQFSKFARAPAASSPVASACKGIPYKEACESVLLSLKTTALPTNPKELFDHSVQFSLSQAHSALNLASIILSQTSHKAPTHLGGGMNDCIELLDDTLDQLSNVINRNNTHTHNDIQTWLSAALTNQETCKESLQNNKFLQAERGIMNSVAQNLTQYISNSLALYVSNYYNQKESNKLSPSGTHGRKLLSDNYFPSWVSLSERKLLESSIREIEAHAVVAKDGSGTHKTIGEAIGLVGSLASGGRTVIYVKAGTYKESLKIPSKQNNVLLVGDGKGKTVIVDDKNAEDGSTTYNSATVGKMFHVSFSFVICLYILPHNIITN